MASLIGRVLGVRNAMPVPAGSGMPSRLPGVTLGAGAERALLRAYKTNGTVQANVSLLASSVAAQKWKLFRKAPADGRVRYTTSDRGSDQRTEVVQHAALNVLDNPAVIEVSGVRLPAWTRFSLMEISGIWMEQTGRSFWVVDHAPGSVLPLGLWPVRPDRMTPVPDPDRYLKGWVYTAPDGMERIPLSPAEVVWNRYPDPEDLYGGCGPVQSVLTDIEASRAAAEWNRNFFVNSAEPGGVLQADHTLSDEEYNQMTDRWRESHQGVSRAHRIALLESGVTWVQTHQSLKDMDFGNLRGVSRDIIREALGMHKVMTGVTDDVNRANAQTGQEVFASWKVAPKLDRWRDNVLNAQLLPLFGAEGKGVEFDYVFPAPVNREADALELKAKTEAALSLVTAGYDQHDVLEAVGLPDMGVALELSTEPALPPRWTLGEPPPPAPAAREVARLRAARPLAPLAKRDAAARVFEQEAEDYPAHAMAWMHHAQWSGPVKVPLDHIEPDLRWMDGASPDHVRGFVRELQQGRKLKPVILVKTPGNPMLQLIDGHHRYLACAELGRPARAWIGTVGADHGPWEQMHQYQYQPPAAGGAGRGDSGAAARGREMAAWNSLTGARR